DWSSDVCSSDLALISDGGRAIVGLPALLELAHWCRERRRIVSGADPCRLPRMGQSPPAPTPAGAPPATEATLDGPAPADTHPCVAGTRSTSGPTSPATPRSRAGGGVW